MLGHDKVSIVIQSNDIVGESPVWSQEEKSLYWVDVIGKKIKRYSFENKKLKTWECVDFPTAIALRKNRAGTIVTFSKGICFFDLDGNISPFVSPELNIEGNRLNEAKCDPAGRLWVGSMQSNLNPDGSMRTMDKNSGTLYRIDGDGSVQQFTEHCFGITNTMAWDLSRERFYFADTLAQTIYTFDYNLAAGEVSKQRVFAHTPERGYPDGSCLDTEGYLWNCRYGGSCLIRFDPDGAIDRIVELPATNITACAFGGKDLATLYVTTARNELAKEEIQNNPYQGSLLALDLGVTGVPEFKFCG